MVKKNVPNVVTSPEAEEPARTGKALRERLKEITAQYDSRRLIGPELPLEDICRQIFDHLIPAMHFPAIASAMIELDGRRFTSENYREGSMHALQSNIAVHDRLCGHLRVFYPDNASFLLPEEQELIDSIACDLERWLKEVNCIYEIRRGAGLELPLEEICQQIFQHLIPALQFPESATVVIELDHRRFGAVSHEWGLTHEVHSKISADNKSCEHGMTHELRSNITVNNRLYGHLRVLYPVDKPFLLPEDQELSNAVAIDLERWLKEVNCIYDVRRGAGLELPLDDFCHQILEHLIPALQFPESATVAIELDDRRFATASHEQGLTHDIFSKITADNKIRGQLRVFYPSDKPFLLPGEQRLIDALAIELEKWLETKKINETLRKRLEEITCLYEIRRSLGLELSFDSACQHIFTHLIPALQFPEIATAMIELDGRRFTSGNQVHGLTHELQSKIIVNKRCAGSCGFSTPKTSPLCYRKSRDSSKPSPATWKNGSRAKAWRRRSFPLRKNISVRLGRNCTTILYSRSRRLATRPRRWR